MKTYNKILDETLYYDRLQNGLKYYIIPKAGYTEKRALLTVNYGSVDSVFERDGKISETPMGVAHFLEHKLFDNEKGSAFDEFSALGAFVNAYTSFNNTAYYFSCSDRFDECLRALLRFVTEPYFSDSSIEKEMGIIEQEISMYDDNPAWAAYFQMLSCLYENHPAKNGIAGTRESVREITKDTLYECYRSFYVPTNIHLICSGGFDERDIERIAEIAGGFPADGQGRAVTVLPSEMSGVKHDKRVREMNVSRPVFQIGFKDRAFGAGVERSCAYKIMLDMFIGESSELRERLVKERLADESVSFDYVNGEQYGYGIISGESANPFELLEICVEHAKSLCQNGFSGRDFERIKRKHIGRFIRGFNSIEAITAASAEYTAKGANLFDCFEGYINCGIEGCNSLICDCFNENSFAIAVLEPEKS